MIMKIFILNLIHLRVIPRSPSCHYRFTHVQNIQIYTHSDSTHTTQTQFLFSSDGKQDAKENKKKNVRIYTLLFSCRLRENLNGKFLFCQRLTPTSSQRIRLYLLNNATMAGPNIAD